MLFLFKLFSRIKDWLFPEKDNCMVLMIDPEELKDDPEELDEEPEFVPLAKVYQFPNKKSKSDLTPRIDKSSK